LAKFGMRFLTRHTGGSAKVLLVTNMWPHQAHPGYGIYVRRQIESLQALGLTCDVIFLEGYRTRWDYLRAALHMVRLNWSKDRPLLVHGHGGETVISLCWFVRGRVVVSYVGDDLLGRPGADGSLIYSSRVRRFVLRQMSRLTSGTITKSEEMEAALPRRTRSRNIVIPNGVNRSLFKPQDRVAARSELGWPLTDRIVLFAADPAVARKRYWLAEAACREAEHRIDGLRLMVAWGLSPDSVPTWMAAADCLLLTSIHEGSPNVVKEALSCNLPVVSTDVGDVRHLLQGVEPSWVCAPDSSALATALVECLAERRRSNGWEQSAWLSQPEIAMRLLDFYCARAPGLAEEVQHILGTERIPSVASGEPKASTTSVPST
jgi:teichuronic acid biosynthesis glycosyltransferase TuaC